MHSNKSSIIGNCEFINELHLLLGSLLVFENASFSFGKTQDKQ